MSRLGTFTVVVISFCAMPLWAAGYSMAPEAQQHFDAATKYFNVSDYPDAIKELKAGYLVDQQPRFLYSIAQAERLEGQCGEAILEYNRYLDASSATTEPDELGRRENAQTMIEKCRAGQSTSSTAPVETTRGPASPPRPTKAPTAPSAAPPKAKITGAPAPVQANAASPSTAPSLWQRHEAAILGSAGTTLLLGAAVTFALLGESADSAAHSHPDTQQAAGSDVSSAKRDYLVANVLFGATAAAAAVTTWLWLRAPGATTGNAAEQATLSVLPLPGGVCATWAGTWGSAP
jgi:hypothetical protein